VEIAFGRIDSNVRTKIMCATEADPPLATQRMQAPWVQTLDRRTHLVNLCRTARGWRLESENWLCPLVPLQYSRFLISRSRTTLPGEDEDEPGSERTLAQLDEGISLNCDNETAQGAASTTTTTDPECESSTSTAEIKASAKKPNVFTDPLNWVDTKAVFAWNITIVNAMTKKKEELSVYNNNTIAEVKTTFIKSTGCDPKTRLFHLVGRGCRELEDEWELRHCVRNRSSVIAFAGDLPSLLTGQTARADNQQTHMPQVIVSQS